MIQPENRLMISGNLRWGLSRCCASRPGMARVQTLHQVLARKKKEKNSRGQPIDQLRVMPRLRSASCGPKNRVTTASSSIAPTIIRGTLGKTDS